MNVTCAFCLFNLLIYLEMILVIFEGGNIWYVVKQVGIYIDTEFPASSTCF
jgi:hypothetical protein